MASTDNLFIGVDVGTGGVRAALVDAVGTILSTSEHPIQIFEPQPGYYEQSSDNIWEACKSTVRVSVCLTNKSINCYIQTFSELLWRFQVVTLNRDL